MRKSRHSYAFIVIVIIMFLSGIHIYNNKFTAGGERFAFTHRTLDSKTNNLKTGPALVTLVTYARSGSTFVGNLLRINKNVFYIFEPLHFLKNVGFNDLHYFDNKTRTFDTEEEAKQFIIRHTLTCSFLDLPLEYWSGFFNDCGLQGHQLCTFYYKYRKERINRLSSPVKFKNVLLNLRKKCESSKTVIIKTIRTPLHLMKPLLTSLVNLKVIHLVRDLRATILSQKFIFKRNVVTTETFCQDVFHDIETFNYLHLTYPGKLYRLVLEDLAMNPLTVTKTLYAFSNLIFSDYVVAVVKRMTLFNVTVYRKKLRSFIPPSKAYSWQLANEWRLNCSLEQVIYVDRSCSEVNEKLGYITVSDESLLRNVSKSLYVNNKRK